MQSELNCPICGQRYTQQNVPRLIPKCGHSFCQKCLQKCLDACTGTTCKIICPEDDEQTLFEEIDINNFPKNIALLKLIIASNKKIESAKDQKPAAPENKQPEAGVPAPSITHLLKQQKDDTFGSGSLEQSHIVKVSVCDTQRDEEEVDQLITAIEETRKEPATQNSKSGEDINNNSMGKLVDIEDICLVHQKPLEIICIKDLTRICSTCAIFGEHKGHEFKSTDEVRKDMKQREECILVLMQIQCTLAQKISGKDAKDQISRQLAIRKEGFIKDIKHRYARLAELIKNSEKKALEKLTSMFVSLEDRIKEDCKIPEDKATRYQKWQERAESQIKCFEQHNNFEEQLQLLNYDKKKNNEQQDILQQGQQIISEIDAASSLILEARQEALKSVVLEYKVELQMKLPEFVSVVVKDTKKSKQDSPDSHKQQLEKPKGRRPSYVGGAPRLSPVTAINHDDDLLLDQKQQADVPLNLEPEPVPKKLEIPMLHEPMLKERLHTVPSTPVYQSYTSRQKSDIFDNLTKPTASQPQTLRTKLAESVIRKSTVKDSSFTLQNTSRTAVVPNNKKKPKLKLPEKFEKLLDAIILDQVENADFTNAQLGDAVTLQIIENIKGKKVRNLKLIRNKLTDQGVEKMLPYFSNITTLNLSQNLLTDRFIDIIVANIARLPNLRNLVLSQNKIKQRNVKARVEEIKKNDINVSL